MGAWVLLFGLSYTFQFSWCSDRCAWEMQNYSLERCLGTFRFQTSVFQHLTHFVGNTTIFGFQVSGRQPPARGRPTADQSRPRVDESRCEFASPCSKPRFCTRNSKKSPSPPANKPTEKSVTKPQSQDRDQTRVQQAEGQEPRPTVAQQEISPHCFACCWKCQASSLRTCRCLLLELPSFKPHGNFRCH